MTDQGEVKVIRSSIEMERNAEHSDILYHRGFVPDTIASRFREFIPPPQVPLFHVKQDDVPGVSFENPRLFASKEDYQEQNRAYDLSHKDQVVNHDRAIFLRDNSRDETVQGDNDGFSESPHFEKEMNQEQYGTLDLSHKDQVVNEDRAVYPMSSTRGTKPEDYNGIQSDPTLRPEQEFNQEQYGTLDLSHRVEESEEVVTEDGRAMYSMDITRESTEEGLNDSPTDPQLFLEKEEYLEDSTRLHKATEEDYAYKRIIDKERATISKDDYCEMKQEVVDESIHDHQSPIKEEIYQDKNVSDQFIDHEREMFPTVSELETKQEDTVKEEENMDDREADASLKEDHEMEASDKESMHSSFDTKEEEDGLEGPMFDECKLEPELSLNEEDVLGPFALLQQQWMKEPTPGLNGQTEKRRKGFPCAQCEYVSRSHQTLLDHINAIHLGVRFQCQLCDYTSKRKRDLLPHYKIKHVGVKFPCDQCDYVACRLQDLKTHTKSKHEGFTYPCPDCDFVGKYHGSLWQHKKRVHEGVQFTCDQCEYSTSNPQCLKEHKQIKHEGIRYSCDLCEKAFNSPYTLDKHKKNIHEKIKYPCDECSYVGNSFHYLQRHKRNNHGQTHTCDQCDYSTNNVSGLRKHKRKVHEGIRYTCEECGDMFRDPPSLKQHVDSIHRGIRFHCDQCEYAGAANMSILRRHIKAKHGGK